MKPEPITADELKDMIEDKIKGNINDPSFNLDAPYEISLPLRDWIDIIDKLQFYEDTNLMVKK